jgi:aminoglycoside phosphotransferase (APT) family kinase protein
VITVVYEIERVLTAAWPRLRVLGPPEPLTGGFWAQMWRVNVTGQPDGMPGELVARLAPHAEMGAKEAEVQRAVAAQGYRTPTVWLSTMAAPPADGWWSVMDFAPGESLLPGLGGAAVLRQAPLLARVLPGQLAQTMASLHRLDPQPVTDAVRRAAPGVAWTIAEVVDRLRLGARALERHDVGAALDRLAARPPGSARPVVCHGDLHPFNILVDDDGFTVLDWTGSILADPRFDVAFTELLLANAPLPRPRPVAPLVRAAGRILARRFLSAYARANPGPSLDGLEWFRAVHSARVVIDVTRLRAEHGPGAGGHPWRLVAPVAARNLSTATGIEVQP